VSGTDPGGGGDGEAGDGGEPPERAGTPFDELFTFEHEPFAGFEVAVLLDRTVYAAADPVRITVTAANRSGRFVEHRYPGWQRYELSVRDELHRVVADDRIERAADGPALDRFAPGQLVIQPTYWSQTSGPVVPAWTSDPAGPRVPPGRYRVRVTWLGREPDRRAELPDAWSPWFALV
jgi:hypothetical protein